MDCPRFAVRLRVRGCNRGLTRRLVEPEVLRFAVGTAQLRNCRFEPASQFSCCRHIGLLFWDLEWAADDDPYLRQPKLGLSRPQDALRSDKTDRCERRTSGQRKLRSRSIVRPAPDRQAGPLGEDANDAALIE